VDRPRKRWVGRSEGRARKNRDNYSSTY
jgi:hypothetical protein